MSVRDPRRPPVVEGGPYPPRVEVNAVQPVHADVTETTAARSARESREAALIARGSRAAALRERIAHALEHGAPDGEVDRLAAELRAAGELP